MIAFHVNPQTGNPGLCRASKSACPFGGTEDHFGSEEEARVAYEAKQTGSFPTPLKSKQTNRESKTSITEVLERKPVKKVLEKLTAGRQYHAYNVFLSPKEMGTLSTEEWDAVRRYAQEEYLKAKELLKAEDAQRKAEGTLGHYSATRELIRERYSTAQLRAGVSEMVLSLSEERQQSGITLPPGYAMCL